MTVETTSTPQVSAAAAEQGGTSTPLDGTLATADLQTQVEELRRQNEQLRTADGAFRQSIRAVAQRYARDHNWCSEVNNALDEIGVPYATTVNFDAVIRVSMQADLITSDEGDLPSFIEGSLEIEGVDHEDVRLRLNSDDWRDVEIDAVTLESIENVTS